MNPTALPACIQDLVGHEFPPSRWIEVTQDRVNRFAEATEDHQFIHVDPERAAATPFGGTIAHGFLTLSLISGLTEDNVKGVPGLAMAINYGADKLRFLQPVPVGSRVRARQQFRAAEEKRPGQWLLKTRITVEIEGTDKPAMIADTLVMLFTR